jgi:hypothetical protein
MAVVSLNGIFTLKVMRSPLMIPYSMGDSPAPWMSIEPVTLPSFVFREIASVWFPFHSDRRFVFPKTVAPRAIACRYAALTEPI